MFFLVVLEAEGETPGSLVTGVAAPAQVRHGQRVRNSGEEVLVANFVSPIAP